MSRSQAKLTTTLLKPTILNITNTFLHTGNIFWLFDHNIVCSHVGQIPADIIQDSCTIIQERGV